MRKLSLAVAAATMAVPTVPTFVLCADDDIITPRYFSEDYAARIPGARSCFMPRGGHALSRTETDQFNAIAIDFFKEVLS